MLNRLIAIGVLFVCAALAWDILGNTLVQRTDDSDASQRQRLSAQWGSPQEQQAPHIYAGTSTPIPIQSSRINVHIDLEQRRKGLLWYNLYQVHFLAHYTLRNDSKNEHLGVNFARPRQSTSAMPPEELTPGLTGSKKVSNPSTISR